MRKSQRPASLGNVVRAAIYRARAERFAPPEFAGRLRSAIKMDVYRLIRRLQAALELDGAKDAAVARVVVCLGEPDAARHMDRRGPLAVRPAKGVPGPRAGDLHGRPGGMGPVVGTPPDQAATPPSARRADAEALAERGRGCWTRCGFPTSSAGNWPC